MTLRLTGSASEPDLLALPWTLPLERWPDDVTIPLPRGISRHVVRFIQGSSGVLAIKETVEPAARREFELLSTLRQLGAPCVEPVGVLSGRTDADGQPLPAVIITHRLPYSMPYRLVMSRGSAEQLWPQLIDALVLLLVRLHLLGFAWGDCSLSNTLFRRDAGEFAAYLVDAETGQFQRALSDGQRLYDLDLATLNVMGELMDLQAGGHVPDSLQPTDVGARIAERYRHVWMTLTDPVIVEGDDRTPIHTLVRTLNGLGFDVGELTADADPVGTGNRISVRAKVALAGHHRRRMLHLTGLDMEENQARRLLNDLDSYRLIKGFGDNERAAARAWAAHVYDEMLRRVPGDLAERVDDAELVHEIMQHRWYLSQRAGHDVGLAAATDDYVATHLRHRPDEAAPELPEETDLF